MAVPPLPASVEGQIAYIKQEREKVIQALVLRGRKVGGVPDPNEEAERSLLPRLDALFDRLESDIEMTGEMKQATKIVDGLNLVFMPIKGFCFSEEHMERARKLAEKYESISSTARPIRPPTTTQDDGDEDERRPAKRRKPSAATDESDGSYIKPPPHDHPIWGTSGIMHGLALKKGAKGRKSTVLNPEYEDEKVEARFFGHNGVKVGSWFPSRLSALFHGAHGHTQAGIHGNPDVGAYSIVVSGQYDLLDEDKGTKLFYSGSGSHENTNPHEAAEATTGTKALDKSLETGRPVRVLRTSEGNSFGRPSEGVRYDGLYQVTGKRYSKNLKGGMYEQFELDRLDEDEEQCSLDACRLRPTGRELGDYERSKDGYASRG